jgi:hypothetical protein
MYTVTFTRITPAGTMAIGMPGSGTPVAGFNRAAGSFFSSDKGERQNG